MDPITAAKIRRHKFGRRKLATDAAWTAYNKCVKNETNIVFINRVSTDTQVQDIVSEINGKLQSILLLFGLTAADFQDGVFDLSTPDNMFIPRSIWYGYIPLPTGQLSEADRETFQEDEKSFADQCGLLRRRIAEIYAAIGILNDVRNDDQRPNRGGVVGKAKGGA